jgi:hypothetical protein
MGRWPARPNTSAMRLSRGLHAPDGSSGWSEVRAVRGDDPTLPRAELDLRTEEYKHRSARYSSLYEDPSHPRPGAMADDVMGAEAAHRLDIARAGCGDDPQTCPPCQLHGIGPDTPTGAGESSIRHAEDFAVWLQHCDARADGLDNARQVGAQSQGQRLRLTALARPDPSIPRPYSGPP